MTKQTRRNIQQICSIPPTSISFVVTLVNYKRKRRNVFHFYFHFRDKRTKFYELFFISISRFKSSQEAPNEMSSQVRHNYIISLYLKWSVFVKCLLSRLRSKSRHCTDNLTLNFFLLYKRKNFPLPGGSTICAVILEF